MDKIEEILGRGVANIVPGKDELRNVLKSGKKLNVYLGIDPTATKMHLGYTVALRKLQKFAELGHKVTFLIGDFTALIGDTSDKNSERPALTKQEIERNFQTYKKQAEKILDFSKVKIRYNSEWLSKLSFEEIVKLCQHFSVGDFIGRELIKERLKSEKRVGLHEVLYPVMQGYDSYFLDTDLQLGATDQTFNIQAGRTLQKILREKESFMLTTPLLEGTDGRKMSKSWGNTINLEDDPADMYAKVMSIDDSLIIQYFMLATNLSINDVKEIEQKLAKDEKSPMSVKKKLAETIVTELHDGDSARKAAEVFEKTVQGGEIPTEMPLVVLTKPGSLADVLVETGLAESKSDAKRLIDQGGVEVDSVKIGENMLPFDTLAKNDETVIQVGKRRFVKVKIENKV